MFVADDRLCCRVESFKKTVAPRASRVSQISYFLIIAEPYPRATDKSLLFMKNNKPIRVYYIILYTTPTTTITTTVRRSRGSINYKGRRDRERVGTE